MIVTKVLGDCPQCGNKDKFGNVSVAPTYLLQGCFSCDFKKEIHLPPVRKKVLYIDQYFLSTALKKKNNDFSNIFEQIKELTNQQFLVAPYSSVHEEETALFEGKADLLLNFIKQTSRGHKFRPAYEIQQKQIISAFNRFKNGETSTYSVDQLEALESNIHVWEDYYWIDVPIDRYKPELQLTLKNEAVNALLSAFEEWRATPNDFEQSLAIEYKAAGDSYLQSFHNHVKNVETNGLEAHFSRPIISKAVELLFNQFNATIPIDEQAKHVHAFFTSAHFYDIPYQAISCRMFAGLREKAKAGAYPSQNKKREKLRGFFGDVEHIATYAPYCDAFITDNFMAEYIKNPKIGLDRYPHLRVFSSHTFEDLSLWLAEIKNNVTTEHAYAVRLVYQ